MIVKKDRNADRVIRHKRVRRNIKPGTVECPRLSVYRSTNHIYAQVIDDTVGHTLCAASTLDKELAKKIAKLTKVEAAKAVGAAVAEKAKALGIAKVVYDRGGYLYTGRVQALADGAREAGLIF